MARKLTKQEIIDIVYNCGIEHPPIIKVLKDLLKDVEIVPEGIQELKDIIREKYKKSVIKNSIAFGNVIAEVLSSVVLQLGLDQFKISNALTSSSYSLKILTEILFGSLSVSSPYAVIVYKDKLNKDEVFNSRKELVAITVGDLIMLGKDFVFPDYKSLPYKYFDIEKMKKIPVLRLNFNVQKMYAHSITFDDIKVVLERKSNKFK